MATTSEIQVTEAYIGLLGRAPDPAGLAYWVAELDAAIAAGQDPAVALKKLTNDITLNDEWLVDGDGSIDVTGGSDAENLANAKTVVTNMYSRLFDRAPTTADLDYWAPKIVSGEFTSSEMAVALVQGAGTTDGDVLGYKQQAATYYVENVAQEDFDKTAAGNSVSSVNGPKSLADSKTATDYIATGVGETSALTTKDGDAITVTAGDDTVTGIAGTMQTNDTMKDLYTSDNDSLTLTETKGFTFGTVTNVENIAVNIEAQLGTSLTIEADKASGGTITLDVAPTVEVAGIDVLGETSVTVNDLASNLVTTDVTKATLDLDTDVTISGDSDLKTVGVTGMNDSGTSIILDNNDSSVTLTGADGTNDAAHVSAVGKVTIDADGGTDVDYLTISGNGGAVVATLSDSDKVTNYTIEGSQDVTLKGANDAFDGTTLTDSSTDGALNIAITGGGNANLSKWAAVDSLSIAGNMDASATVTYKAGNLTATVDATQDAGDELVLMTNDVTASKTATLDLTLNNDVGELSTGTGEANDFDIVNIGTGTKSRTIDEIDMDGSNSIVTIVGQNDVTITGAAAAGGLTVETTKAFSAGAVTATSEAVSITADKITLSSTVGTENDGVTLTATNDVSVSGAITVTNESGDLVDVTGAKVTLNNITATDIALTATNDKAASSAGTLLAEGDLSVDSGTWTISSMTANDGTLTISGDAKVTATNSNATDGITITSTCDVDLGAVGAGGTVLNASGATGGVTASFGAGYASQVTVVTNTGADDITANNDVVFNIQTGAGKDTVTITSVDGLSVINTGADNDTLKVNDTDNDYQVYGGSGADSFTLAADVNAKVYGDDGDDSFTLGNDVGAAIDGGNDTDTVALAGGNDYSGDGMTWANIEKVSIVAGSATIDATTFASDNTFELVGTGSETLTIGATAGVAATINASGVTTGGFSAGGIIINGDNQADTLTASNYSDTINGGAGDDKIYGGSQIDGANDVLNGDAGNDTINGNAGIDIIDGGNGADVIDGGAGNDVITGGRGQDDMTGGSGADTFVFVGGTGNDGHGFTSSTTLVAVGNDADVITDFSTGNDVIDLTKGNDTGTGALVDEANGALISDDNEAANYAAVVTKAEAAFAAGNDVYVSVDAFDSGNAYVFVDSDNSDTLTDNDLVIVLTGIDNTAEISNDDFSF